MIREWLLLLKIMGQLVWNTIRYPLHYTEVSLLTGKVLYRGRRPRKPSRETSLPQPSETRCESLST